jgi:hypothetical protein
VSKRTAPRRLMTAAVLSLLIALLPAAGAGAVPADPVLNEFSASTTGTDVEWVEVFGDPSTDYSGFTVLEVEGDITSTSSTIDEVIAVGTTGPSGFYPADPAATPWRTGPSAPRHPPASFRHCQRRDAPVPDGVPDHPRSWAATTRSCSSNPSENLW